MKKILLTVLVILSLSSQANAYYIGGAYATLLSCSWGQQGYEYGNIGVYRLSSNNQIYQVFFGSNYCEY